MSALFHIASKQEHPFWRCGVKFSRKGGTFAQDRFSDEEWGRLRSEKMLSIKEIAADDVSPAQAASDLEARIKAVISDLTTAEFGASGVPGVGAIRAALPDDAKSITSSLRDDVFKGMLDAGFKVPVTDPDEGNGDVNPDQTTG